MSPHPDPDLPLLRAAQLRPSAPDLARVLDATRTGTQEAFAHIALEGEPPPRRAHLASQTSTNGQEYLLFTCGSVQCAAPLLTLREVLPKVPHFVRLPFSPSWMLGIFALRSELLGLIDPGPLLLGTLGNGQDSTQQSVNGKWPEQEPATALVLGEGERSLALAVSGIGEIFTFDDETSAPSGQLTAGHATIRPVRAEYVQRVYQLADHAAPCVLLDTTRLLDDLLRALEGRTHRTEA